MNVMIKMFGSLVLALVTPAIAADYDLVILNGRVMDPATIARQGAQCRHQGQQDRRHHH